MVCVWVLLPVLGEFIPSPLPQIFKSEKRSFAGGNWNGTIDEVMIFNHSLSAEQIHALFNNRTNVIAAQETIRGENWTVIGYPNNRTGDGAPVTSNSVRILSVIPTHSTPILNTTNMSKQPDGSQSDCIQRFNCGCR